MSLEARRLLSHWPVLPVVSILWSVRRQRLSWLFSGFSMVMVTALIVVAIVALRALQSNHNAAASAATADLVALEDATALEALLYQKGFTAGYLLTGDRRWLDELNKATPVFETWLAHVTKDANDPATAQAVTALVAEYGRYDIERARAREAYDNGQRDEAIRLLSASTERAVRLHGLAGQLTTLRREEVRTRLHNADRDFHRAVIALGASIFVAVLMAAASGYWLAQRISRPLRELVRRASIVSGNASVEIEDELAALSTYVTRLAHQMAQAEKMSALGELAAGVAHEVLNPLTGVKTALQLLKRQHTDEDVQATVAPVDIEIHRVESMARQLTSFARPLQPAAVACDPQALMQRAIAATRFDAEARRVRVATENSVDTLRADPDLVLQILVNLVANACQATEDGSDVVLRTRHEPGWTIVEVADHGAGLAAEVRDKLFTPFVTTKRNGNGLGLAMSQSIAVAHGGRIEARANEGRGTVFSLWLPVSA